MRVLFALLALVACAFVSAQNNGNIGANFTQISGFVNTGIDKTPTLNPFPIGVPQATGQTTWTRRNNLGTAASDLRVFVLAGFEGIRDASGQQVQTLRSDVHESEDGGATWRVVSYSNVWRARNALTAVAFRTTNPANGQSVTALMFAGGQINGAVISDTWISYDSGASWSLQCFNPEQVQSPFADGRTNFAVPSCRWKGRYGHTMTSTSNGVVILAGGADNVPNGLNDVWRTSNNGATWTQLNGVPTTDIAASPNQLSPQIWRARYNHAMTLTPPLNNVPTSSFVLVMGGRVPNQLNDVWRSVDALSIAAGSTATWELLTAAPGWAPRFGHGATTLQCIGAIYVIGGDVFNSAARGDTSIITSGNDVWVSTTNGQTWSLVASNAGFSVRELFGLVQTSTTLVLLGGVRANANGNFLDFSVASPFYDDVWSTNFAGYLVGAYGACQCNSGIAGFGTRTRTVSCPASSSTGATCCLPPVPVTVESCPCYAWLPSGFGACSVTCGGGAQTQTVSCINTVTGANLGLAGTGTPCDSVLSTPPASVQSCNTQACPVCSWTVGAYGPCSQTCGTGIQTRNAPICADQFGVQRTSTDPCCPANRPATQQNCNQIPCPTHVLGDPEFFGFAGQKYEIHGVPDQVFNIITSPLVQYNALFVYIGHKSAYHCNKTRTHPWTHAGTYLGSLGIQTAGGDKLELHSGTCQKGIKSITLNGKKLKVGDRKMLTQVPESGITQQVYFKDIFTVEVRLAEVTIHLTNSDNFFNQEVALTTYGEEKLSTHGLLGQTWNKKTYVVDGVRRVIEGVPTDYLVQEEELFGTNFIYNRFNVKSDE